MKYNKFQPPPGTSENNKGTCNGTIVMESPIHQKGALENEVKEVYIYNNNIQSIL